MKELVCIVCPRGCRLQVDEEKDWAVTGNACPRGAVYGKEELTAPTRVVTTTAAVEGAIHSRCPVKTSAPIPKALVRQAVASLDGLVLQAPVKLGQVVLADVCGCGADFVACREMPRLEK